MIDKVKFVVGRSLTLLLAGCMTPPCTCATPTNASLAGANSASPAAPCVSPPPVTSIALTETAANGSRVAARKSAFTMPVKIVWDGDEKQGSALGWANCDTKPGCKASLAVAAGTGRNNSTGLKFHGEGAGWIGCGWNLFGWWPAGAGIDVTGYTYLKLAIRIEAKSAEMGPNIKIFNIYLTCSDKKENCTSETLNPAEQTKENLIDGRWHELNLPLAALVSKTDFNPRTVWEIDLSTWSESAMNFDIYLDDIALSSD